MDWGGPLKCKGERECAEGWLGVRLALLGFKKTFLQSDLP